MFVNEVLPQLEELHLKYDDFSERIWINVLGIKNYIVIKEDVKRYGNYSYLSPAKGLDLAHCKVVIISLAKYHAMTAILANEKKIPLEKFDKSFMQRSKDVIRDYYAVALKAFADTIDVAWGPEWVGISDRVREKAKTIQEKMIRFHDRNESDFNVINFGDLSIYKILFKYSVSDVIMSQDPIAIKVDGYLTSFYNSPAFDLQEFIASSPKVEVMVKHKNELIELYYHSLVRYLKKFEYKGKIPELDDIKNEIKRTDLYGLVICINFLNFSYVKPEEMVDVEKLVQKAHEKNKTLVSSNGMLGKQYIETMKQLIQKAIDENIL